MLRQLSHKSLAYGVPGIVLQCIGLWLCPPVAHLGNVLPIAGLAYYAKAKGHSGFFGLLGLLSWFGVVVLLILKDRRHA